MNRNRINNMAPEELHKYASLWWLSQTGRQVREGTMTMILDLRKRLMKGIVIPAHPLALTSHRKLDERRQRALTRYYLAAGAGGIAVGVHTTQFEIHDADVGFYQPVLELAADEARRFTTGPRQAPVKVAGLVGKTLQATR